MTRPFLKAALLAGFILLVVIAPAHAQPSACVPPPSGLVAWWPADVDAGDIWGANPGTLTNGASIVPGISGNAFSLDGIDDFIDLNNGPSMDFGTGDFTISVWINVSSLTGIHEILHKSVGNVLDGTNQTYFLEYLGEPQRLRFRVGDVEVTDTETFNDLIVPVSVTAGQWHHVAAVRLGDMNLLYLDGLMIGSQTAGHGVDTGTGGQARIGQIAPNGVSGQNRPFAGLIDEVQLFNRALCHAEISKIVSAVLEGAGMCKDGSTGGATCDDECMTGSVCDRGGCVGGDPVNCDDGNLCTDDACFSGGPFGGGCQYRYNTRPCDDGNACSTGDVCQTGVCRGTLPLEVCNNLDDDCNGLVDDGIPPTPTTCGVGACSAIGTLSCLAGAFIDSCHAGTPAASDATCDGVDDDCDGTADEEYQSVPTSCGVGACRSTGTTSCVGGMVVDSCHAGTPAPNDATCNGIDDDCDGAVDENYPSVATTCGIGACHSTGATSCVGGSVVDSCHAGTPAASDTTCNGIDDDCDGTVDEDYLPVATSCGVGACRATGMTSCVGGTVVDSCRAGTPALDDATCNGVDDDCDGATDENYAPVATACGVGACHSNGTTSCVGGTVVDSCHAGAPSAEICNGIDDDCDGTVDDGADVISTCGVGRCGGSVHRRCIGGVLEPDTCTPQPDGTMCDDGIDCTTGDACSSGACVGVNQCVSRITPMTSSCRDFLSGPAASLDTVAYRTKGTTLQSAQPRAFNDFSTLVAPAADFTITVTQSHTLVAPDWPPVGIQGPSQIDLFNLDCTKSSRQGLSQFDPATGTVTIEVAGAVPGQFYVVGIKYQTDSLVSTTVLRPHPVVIYTFTTSGSGSDTVRFVPMN
jgi:concanavalin A-like lectin/glucanase superfamily protein/putative metal-binding protein